MGHDLTYLIYVFISNSHFTLTISNACPKTKQASGHIND